MGCEAGGGDTMVLLSVRLRLWDRNIGIDATMMVVLVHDMGVLPIVSGCY